MRSLLFLSLLFFTVQGAIVQQPKAIVVEADGKEWSQAKLEIEDAVEKLKAELFEVRKEELKAAALMRASSVPKTLTSEYVDAEGHKFLCKPCNFLFETIRDELIKESRLNLEIVRPKVDAACKKWSHNVSFLDRVCEKLVDQALVSLTEWLRAEEEKINPERICVFLHMC
ncbi:unnamed protein product [Bursaphelenchus okinawaensis]|uniref:Saposin B-type domain-containing protein n=1 Tax=Bursaphelenchus okinawaensis TaxID=465554 RepID=A0A811K0P9_9BILA|nr:unnamed protein product [Bursaphelenchus okinawaensis]CAG9088260.1 unnamed protein product [Bursaphelenchus okinawaensis]